MKSTAVKRKIITYENNPSKDLADERKDEECHVGHQSRVNEGHATGEKKIRFRIPLKKHSDANKTATGMKEIAHINIYSNPSLFTNKVITEQNISDREDLEMKKRPKRQNESSQKINAATGMQFYEEYR